MSQEGAVLPIVLPIVLSGATGRMGKSIKHCAPKMHARIVLELSRSKPPSACAGFKPTPGMVVVDFSLPQAFAGVLEFCLKHSLALVSGTTGLNAEQMSHMRQAAKTLPLLWAPNMSLGIHWLKQVAQKYSLLKGSGFRFLIEETHHVHKKDSPSGTALFLKQSLKEHIGDMPIEAHRQGECLGEHSIKAISSDEEITITHRALSRGLFACGALKAAHWISEKKPGTYTIDQMLEQAHKR